ncbi:MAG: shikimate kinase [Prevotellaceae bacterium]|jgi:shikimate kinase|nr:shikimate kinase [Prevotellaceae bacterium]
MSKNHIILLGMPGSGKSTIGFHLAKLMKIPFIDTDRYIVNKMQKPINDIFNEAGEEAFREMENRTLTEILKKRGHFVISVGGGMPCFHNNMKIMNENAITVYLELSAEDLFQYLKNDKKRPLLSGKSGEELMQYIRATLDVRQTYYEKADIKIHAHDGTPAEFAAKLLNVILRFRTP